MRIAVETEIGGNCRNELRREVSEESHVHEARLVLEGDTSGDAVGKYAWKFETPHSH